MNPSGLDENNPSPKGAARRFFKTNQKLMIVGAVVLVLVVLAITLLLSGNKPTRTESYKDVSGAAGLSATITHDGKLVSDVNIYIFKDDGQQISVVRPDKDGKVNLALPEGDYVMLIGKPFGQSDVFPQESLELKNGKKLEVKLQYGES